MEVYLFGYLGHRCFLACMAFYFLLLCFHLMRQALKVDWSVTFPITSIFTTPISSGEVSYDLLHRVLASSLHFCAC
jgi:hypothetical protein